MACGGYFLQKISNFNFIKFIFSCYYCSIDLKRQSEHSGLCYYTSSLFEALRKFEALQVSLKNPVFFVPLFFLTLFPTVCWLFFNFLTVKFLNLITNQAFTYIF